MSAPKPLEEQLLAPALRVLGHVAPTPDARFEVLEALASRLGGFRLETYRELFDTTHVLCEQRAHEGAKSVFDALKGCRIPPALALCALARPQITLAEQRTSGAYYTDFRLAQYVAAAAESRLVAGAQIIDPAAGTGILLVAASLVACGPDRRCRASWLAESVTAWDLSRDALRGARLALASLTDDLSAVETMVSRWRCHDSLLVKSAPWGQFDVVLGNPPWKKIKLTRHEFLTINGSLRHYGDDYKKLDEALFAFQRDQVVRYGSALALRYPLLGCGDPDLYKAFLELFLRLSRPQGCISVLVPAGLIRSQGTEELRKYLNYNAGELSFTIMDNRARFFAIDSRFKFLGLVLTKSGPQARRQPLRLVHAKGTDYSVSETGKARIGRRVLESIRPDLTIPEVRSEREWRIFRKMSKHATSIATKGSPWESQIVREVDMTRDRKNFVRSAGAGQIALIEGRMIHQHRFGAKAYRTGTGRRAKWDIVPIGTKELTPQFWYPQDRLSHSIRDRVSSQRAGFCDITGQTNERSMLAALVPPGVVCGNKVPTVTFLNDKSENRLFLWLAIVNSITFDWALRRIVTTTVNYFLLKSVPFPKLQPDSLPGRRLVEYARELHKFDVMAGSSDIWRIAELRASIDVAVHAAYGLSFRDLELILRDFPLLDRGQPPIDGERQSTITRDFLLVQAAGRFKVCDGLYVERLQAAREIGAVPYIPSEFMCEEVWDAAEESDG